MTTEIEKIRKKFQASRKQFAEVFLGRSESSIKSYEKGKTPIPASVLMLARVWERHLDEMKGQQTWNK